MAEKSMAAEVAENIYWAAVSGSASWDEVNGPRAERYILPADLHVIAIPAGWDDDDPESAKEWCEITITMRPGKPEIVSGLTPEEGR